MVQERIQSHFLRQMFCVGRGLPSLSYTKTTNLDVSMRCFPPETGVQSFSPFHSLKDKPKVYFQYFPSKGRRGGDAELILCCVNLITRGAVCGPRCGITGKGCWGWTCLKTCQCFSWRCSAESGHMCPVVPVCCSHVCKEISGSIIKHNVLQLTCLHSPPLVPSSWCLILPLSISVNVKQMRDTHQVGKERGWGKDTDSSNLFSVDLKQSTRKVNTIF